MYFDLIELVIKMIRKALNLIFRKIFEIFFWDNVLLGDGNIDFLCFNCEERIVGF
jgi:hypothetical protein